MGVLGVFKDSVTLINRTSRSLNVRYDGEDITIAPGENPGFPRVAVPYAKKQNALNGSQNPINPNQYICLVGVKGDVGGIYEKDDITPIPDEVLEAADKKLERVDRSGEHWGEPMENRRLLRKNGFSPFEARVREGTATDLP